MKACLNVNLQDEALYGLHLGLAPVDADLKLAPAPLPCRVKVAWETDTGIVAIARGALGSSRPLPQELQHRDPGAGGGYSSERPFWAEVSEARYETAAWSERKVLHLQMELADSGMVYEAGDSIGILPENNPDLVKHTINRLGLSPDAVFTVNPAGGGGQVSVRDGARTSCSVHPPLPSSLVVI